MVEQEKLNMPAPMQVSLFFKITDDLIFSFLFLARLKRVSEDLCLCQKATDLRKGTGNWRS